MAKTKPPEVHSISPDELIRLKSDLKAQLAEPAYQLVSGLLDTLQFLMGVIEHKTYSIARLKRMIFGHRTEKAPRSRLDGESSGTPPKPPPKGHGRKGAKDYPGARTVRVPHPQHQVGERCPKCEKGKLYLFKEPARLIRIVAQPLFQAVRYELERLRCSVCGALFTAPAPPEAGSNKYDPSVGTMLAIMRYGAGLPMYRMDKWQTHFGVPLPAGTQWQLIDATAKPLEGVYQGLIDVAAQGSLVHNDDTSMRVQELAKQIAADQEQNPSEKNQRTGIFTSGIVAQTGDHQVALFFTGRRHAGENLADLLQRRASDLEKPLQMCDALSRNDPEQVDTTLCNCILHGRRNFLDVAKDFPRECQKVIETISLIYRIDAQAKKEKLTDAQRLALHQEHSRQPMEQLHKWMKEQLEQHNVEPNSTLGEAMAYMIKHWVPLTRFLEVPGAPLDNNICERALKMAILHRKNSLRYKTFHGAEVGDIFMSLIHTSQLNRVNPFDYLMALQNNAERVKKDPVRWLPWNFQAAICELAGTG